MQEMVDITDSDWLECTEFWNALNSGVSILLARSGPISSYIMSKRQQSSRGSAQELAKSVQNSPNKAKKTDNVTPKAMKETKVESINEMSKIDELYKMMQTVLVKLETLDLINEHILSVEQNVKSLTESIEFAHAEISDLKEEMVKRKETERENYSRIKELEDSNQRLQDSVVDLKARSMRDNLLFHNIDESEEEDCTEVIYSLLEEKLDMPEARSSIKIDRVHRVGRKRDGRRKQESHRCKIFFSPIGRKFASMRKN